MLIGVGLLTIVFVAFGIFRGLGRPVEGSDVLAERFGYATLPFGLEVSKAHQLGTGDKLVRLDQRADAEVPDDAPDRVIILFHANDVAPGLLFPPSSDSVDPEKLQEWKADATKTFKGEITRGRVDFGSWSTPYIRERMFRDTGHWVDSMRVNLSNSEINCVLFAEFPPEVDGTEARLVELLEALELK
jgi:hypothetical protein